MKGREQDCSEFLMEGNKNVSRFKGKRIRVLVDVWGSE